MEIRQNIVIRLTFSPDDLALVQQSGAAVPPFWSNHLHTPALHDVLRFGGRQYTVTARVWEHDEQQPVLRLYLGQSEPQSDANFH